MEMATQQPGRRNTRGPMPAAGAKKTTAGHRAVASPAPRKNTLPIILAAAGGGLLLILLPFVVLGGSNDEGTTKKKDTANAPAAGKPKAPDVSGLEAEGEKKCKEGAKVCEEKLPRLAGTSGDQKAKIRAEIEAGLKKLDEGLAVYKKARELAGKTYDLAAYERVRAGTVETWSTDVEKEALGSCDEALKLVQSLEAFMRKETTALTADEKKTLVDGLVKAKHLHEHGMQLCNRSQEFTGHGFDVSQYGQAYKAVKLKLLELK